MRPRGTEPASSSAAAVAVLSILAVATAGACASTRGPERPGTPGAGEAGTPEEVQAGTPAPGQDDAPEKEKARTPEAEGAAAPESARSDVAELVRLHDEYVAAGLSRRFQPDDYWAALSSVLAEQADRFRVRRIGESVEGRPLRRVDFGNGPVPVLLWSQMHGDESTASRALVDLFRYLAGRPDDPRVRRIEEGLRIRVIPVLNPDGAARFRRHNALGIDINRDARALATPEGRALKRVRDEIGATWGFNLHDQSVRTRRGDTDENVQISLLAPPPGEGETNAANRRAARLAGLLVGALRPLVGDGLARYSESFNPRAFGDLMTRWGTGTVLIEAGGTPDDPEKELPRKANFVALATALDAIATGAWERASPGAYRDLPPNGRQVADLVLRGGSVVLPGREPVRADVEIRYDDSVGRAGGRIAEIGDLEDAEALRVLDIDGLYFVPEARALSDRHGLHLAPGDRAEGVIARDPEGEEPVWRLEDGRPVLVEQDRSGDGARQGGPSPRRTVVPRRRAP